MAAQGRTVDHALLVVDGPIDAAGLYVPMTRGREGNDVWVVTESLDPGGDGVDLLAEVMHRRWIDQSALDCLPAAAAAVELD